MPARQDQTLQIFLIIFIFAFLVTAVVAYLGWRGSSEANARAVALEASFKKASEDADTRKKDLGELHPLMGLDPNATTPAVKDTGKADMTTYGSGIADEASRTYRKV